MKKVRSRGEAIRRFILLNTEKHSSEISKMTAKHFGITRQALNKHLQRLVLEGVLVQAGNTVSKIYKLATSIEWRQNYALSPALAEDQVWKKDIQAALGSLPDNVMNIWHHAFTEMFNNAIDHSNGTIITVNIKKTAVSTRMAILDNGIGIFKNIQTKLNLIDERHALLELSKGKLTTDPKRHSGEGIFFTSRMCDQYDILSGGVHFSHAFSESEDWIFESENKNSGTSVIMALDNHTARTTKKIFDEYTSGDDYGFNRTVVPVRLAQYDNDNLISRSQAKRLLARIDKFKIVILDFSEVEMIGQAFADEIFRVFALEHTNITITFVHANAEVEKMISRAKAHKS